MEIPHISYSDYVEKRIRQKLTKLMRRSLLLGQRQAESMCNEVVGKLQKGMRKINQTKIDLIIGHAEHLIAERLATEPQTIVPMIEKLLKNIAEHTDVEITAHPRGASLIKAALGESVYPYTSARKVAIHEDEGFAVSSLIIKANKSIIDAQVKTELERAKVLLETALKVNQIREANGQAH